MDDEFFAPKVAGQAGTVCAISNKHPCVGERLRHLGLEKIDGADLRHYNCSVAS